MENSFRKKKEEFEMLEALYDYKATVPQTLSFSRDDLFIFHSGNDMEKNWWSVVNIKGKMGYIPSNYVSSIKVSKEKFMDFLNHSLEHLGRDISRESGGTFKQLELMQELITKKQELLDHRHKVKPSRKEKLSASKSLPNSATDSQLTMCQVEDNCVSNAPSIHPDMTYTLIQKVRSQTGLSYEASRIATSVVAEGLLEMLPSIVSASMECFFETLHSDIVPSDSVLDDTPDSHSLRKIFSHLTMCKEDAQQRSWHLWDDETTIKQQITQLISILSNAHTAISCRVLKSSGFSDVSMLVEYYQMEDRWSIRKLLLQAFSVICTLDKIAISILLNSVLPMELAREMQSNIKCTTRLSKPALLLSMIFSMGEPMPITHLEHLGKDFIRQMFELIEDERETEDVSDSVLTLLLSYNLQFKPQSTTNIMVQALAELDCAKTFTEKVLLLINREEDPLKQLKTHKNSFHSVLKLLKDLFNNSVTAKLFYTNDTRVLIDIILRQITDLPPNNERRTDYLELCRLVMLSCETGAFEHRIEELRSRFIYILTEEMPPVSVDRALVREIMLGLPQHFGECPLQTA